MKRKVRWTFLPAKGSGRPTGWEIDTERVTKPRVPTISEQRSSWGAVLLLTVAGLIGAPCHALSSDGEQPINIEADQAEADDLNGVTIYRGDVVITQGSLRIAGDVVTIHFDDAQEMTKLVAEGNPATFHQMPDGEGGLQNAEARTMEFYAKDDTIVLLGEAHAWQGDDSIKAERIVYDTRQGKVKAESQSAAASGGEGGETQVQPRVKITIAPKKKASQPE
jgi:lipopolysaccharide export system protein LptA